MSVNYQISTNPYTLKINSEVPVFTSDELNQSANLVFSAKKKWASKTLDERLGLLDLLKNEIINHRLELATIITSEIGCPISQTLSEVDKTVSIFDYFKINAHQYLQLNTVVDNETTNSYISYQPLGTLLHISPFNYPLYLAFRPVIPALVAGNTVLLKTPSNTPMLAQKLMELITKSQLDKGILEVVLVSGSNMSELVKNENVNIVSVIGSDTAGKAVASLAGECVTKTILELGGSDPFVVFEDCDIDKAVEGATFSRLRNAGQSCNAAKRFIVQESIKEEFIKKLKASFESQIAGDPMDEKTNCSPISTLKGLNQALAQIEDAVSKGAEVITGGKHDASLGYFLVPTILDKINKDMLVYREETFAPIAPIISFNSVEEALELANDTKYGLGASVWTSNENVQNFMINNLEAGSVFINSVVRGSLSLPYGGIKKSGYGREFAEVGIKEFVNIKSVSKNKS